MHDADGSVELPVMPEKGQVEGRALILLRFGYQTMNTKTHPWYKPRGYVHFDNPLGRQAAEQLVSDPDLIAKHAFYPLLRYEVTTQKIEKSRVTGKAVRKEPKKRPISFAAHADAHIYAYYNYLLGQAYEEQLRLVGVGESVLAFRALGKSNINFANEAFETIKAMGECVAFATDITGFFDNLRHSDLKRAWTAILGVKQLPRDHYAVFKSLTRYAYVIKEPLFKVLGLSPNNPPRSPARLCTAHDFRTKVRDGGLITPHKDTKGIPQGSPMSAFCMRKSVGAVAVTCATVTMCFVSCQLRIRTACLILLKS